MTKERKRPAIMESHPITCPHCGHVTNISYNRRKDEPRLCRNCGAVIAEPPTEAQPMSAERVAEAFRILGVHCNKRHQLANDLLQVNGPWTLPQLALSAGINDRKIYDITQPLRDLNILQPTRPTEPSDWHIIYPPKQLAKKRRDLGVTGTTRYTYNETALIHAIIKKADAERDQILSVLQETQP